jgi:putative glutamine amidotransferase
LAEWAGGDTAMVNSLHGQGIDRLADDLLPMAYAPDGLVEAVQVRSATAFAYAVQWHPEWRCQDNPFYLRIFQAFGQACRLRQEHRSTLAPTPFTATA